MTDPPQHSGVLPIVDFDTRVMMPVLSEPKVIETPGARLTQQIKLEQRLIADVEDSEPLITYTLSPLYDDDLEVVVEWQNFMLEGFIYMLADGIKKEWLGTKHSYQQEPFETQQELNKAFNAAIWRNWWVQEPQVTTRVNTYFALKNLAQNSNTRGAEPFRRRLNTWRNKLRQAYTNLPGNKPYVLEVVQRNVTALETHGGSPKQVTQIRDVLAKILSNAEQEEDTVLIYRVRSLAARLELLHYIEDTLSENRLLEPMEEAEELSVVITDTQKRALFAGGPKAKPTAEEDIRAAIAVFIDLEDPDAVYYQWEKQSEYRNLSDPRESFKKMLNRLQKRMEENSEK